MLGDVDGENEIEEHAEDAEEVNVDWPWNSVGCAVKLIEIQMY